MDGDDAADGSAFEGGCGHRMKLAEFMRGGCSDCLIRGCVGSPLLGLLSAVSFALLLF